MWLGFKSREKGRTEVGGRADFATRNWGQSTFSINLKKMIRPHCCNDPARSLVYDFLTSGQREADIGCAASLAGMVAFTL